MIWNLFLVFVIKLVFLRYGGANIKNPVTMDNENYTLTKRDKAYLMKIGYLSCDLPYIERAVGSMKYEYWKRHGEEKIDRERAITLVGKQAWLSGIGRACFHASAVRETKGSHKGRSEVFFENVGF